MFWNRGASAEKDGADDDLFNFSPSAFKEEAKDERLSFTSVEDATNPIEGEGIDNRALLGADSFSNMGGDYEDVYAQYDRALRLFKKRQKRCCICCGVTTVLATASILLLVFLFVPPTIHATLSRAQWDFGPEVNFTTPSSMAAALAEQVVHVETTSTLTLRKSLWCDADLDRLKLNLQVKSSFAAGASDPFDEEEKEDGEKSWINVGRLHLPSLSVPKGKTERTVALRGAKLAIKNAEGWEAFTGELFRAKKFRWRLHGTLDVTLFAMGQGVFSSWTLAYPDYRFTAEGSSVGMSGFSNGTAFRAPTVDGFNVGATFSSAEQKFRLGVYNPSPFQLLPFGRLAMGLAFRGRAVSASNAATAANVSLTRGWNSWTLKGLLEPSNATLLDALASRYFAGESSAVALVAASNGTSPARRGAVSTKSVYASGLQGFQVPATMHRKGGKLNLTTEAVLQVNHDNIITKDDDEDEYEGNEYEDKAKGLKSHTVTIWRNTSTLLPFWCGVVSPFPASRVIVEGFEGHLLYNGEVVGNVDEKNLEIVIDPVMDSSGKGDGGTGDHGNKQAAVALAGANTSHTMHARLAVYSSDGETVNPATEALLTDLVRYGYAPHGLGVTGFLTLRMGPTVTLRVAFAQPAGMPTCDYHYATTHHNASESVCGYPPTDAIVGENLRTRKPSSVPTPVPTESPAPTPLPTGVPTLSQPPTPAPSYYPTPVPTPEPTYDPTRVPTPRPSHLPTPKPTRLPVPRPTTRPTPMPTSLPVPNPTTRPTPVPTPEPTYDPTWVPVPQPTYHPTPTPTALPTTAKPSSEPSPWPSHLPSYIPTPVP
jgi:hypothetical protein